MDPRIRHVELLFRIYVYKDVSSYSQNSNIRCIGVIIRRHYHGHFYSAAIKGTPRGSSLRLDHLVPRDFNFHFFLFSRSCYLTRPRRSFYFPFAVSLRSSNARELNDARVSCERQLSTEMNRLGMYCASRRAPG